MYDVPHFKAGHNNEVIAFMQAHPFIILCGCGHNGFPVATHVPVLIEERENVWYLSGHIMRGQAHTESFKNNAQILAIFSGAHAYISASWYKQKNIASTWNYRAVHAQGILRFLDDEGLYHLLEKLTSTHEATGSPALMEHMKPGYVQSLMKQIIAFEVKLTHIDHVFKESQNRDSESQASIVTHLEQQDDAGAKETASIMRGTSKP